MATNFQKSVWAVLEKIPRGRVTTYGAIASCLNTRAVRAVGTAVGKNPNAPEVPCHRVVLSSGKIGKYSGDGGVFKKTELLKKEGVEVENRRIVNFEKIVFYF